MAGNADEDATTNALAVDVPTIEDSLAVQLVGVNKWFGDFHVLKDIDLEVLRGERIVVCGPSGSGKSTMIRSSTGWRSTNKVASSLTASSSPMISRGLTRCAARWVWCFNTSIYFRT